MSLTSPFRKPITMFRSYTSIESGVQDWLNFLMILPVSISQSRTFLSQLRVTKRVLVVSSSMNLHAVIGFEWFVNVLTICRLGFLFIMRRELCVLPPTANVSKALLKAMHEIGPWLILHSLQVLLCKVLNFSLVGYLRSISFSKPSRASIRRTSHTLILPSTPDVTTFSPLGLNAKFD